MRVLMLSRCTRIVYCTSQPEPDERFRFARGETEVRSRHAAATQLTRPGRRGVRRRVEQRNQLTDQNAIMLTLMACAIDALIEELVRRGLTSWPVRPYGSASGIELGLDDVHRALETMALAVVPDFVVLHAADDNSWGNPDVLRERRHVRVCS
jgi:hypothetical protein